MYCTQCGTEITGEARYCSQCGYRLKPDAPPGPRERLMLDKENKKIAGVCAGIARYRRRRGAGTACWRPASGRAIPSNPALALKDGKPVMAWNTPGGDNQPQAMLQAFLNVVEFGMNPQLAVEQPTVTTSNFHASNYPQPVGDRLTVPAVLADRIAAELRAKGHKLEVTLMQRPYSQQPAGAGAVNMVWIDPRTGVFFGAVSPAKDDYAIGW